MLACRLGEGVPDAPTSQEYWQQPPRTMAIGSSRGWTITGAVGRSARARCVPGRPVMDGRGVAGNRGKPRPIWPGRRRAAQPRSTRTPLAVWGSRLTATLTATGPDFEDQGEPEPDDRPRSQSRTYEPRRRAQNLQARGRQPVSLIRRPCNLCVVPWPGTSPHVDWGP